MSTRVQNLFLLSAAWMLVVGGWIIWAEYRLDGLQTRLNLVEAGQHWQEEPPAREVSK